MRRATNRPNLDRAFELMQQDPPPLDEVWQLLHRAEEAGEDGALYAIATWYLHGRHVRRDRKRAVALLHEAVERGDIDAMYDLAVCFEEGAGVEQDEKRAFELYLGAALRGEPKSMVEVGRCFYHGIGVGRSRRVAEVFFRRAEELGLEVD